MNRRPAHGPAACKGPHSWHESPARHAAPKLTSHGSKRTRWLRRAEGSVQPIATARQRRKIISCVRMPAEQTSVRQALARQALARQAPRDTHRGITQARRDNCNEGAEQEIDPLVFAAFGVRSPRATPDLASDQHRGTQADPQDWPSH